MKTIRTASYRGWNITIKESDERKLFAEFGNEHRVFCTEEELEFKDADLCERHAILSIDMYDAFEPHLRSAEFVSVEPPDYKAWLLGEE